MSNPLPENVLRLELFSYIIQLLCIRHGAFLHIFIVPGFFSRPYVDRFAFTELHGFLQPENYLKSAEMAMEDDYNMVDGIINNGTKQPTVAELEEQAKSGQSISLLDLAEAVQREQEEKRQKTTPEKKPSILAKIRKPLPAKEEQKAAPDRSAEREYSR